MLPFAVVLSFVAATVVDTCHSFVGVFVSVAIITSVIRGNAVFHYHNYLKYSFLAYIFCNLWVKQVDKIYTPYPPKQPTREYC